MHINSFTTNLGEKFYYFAPFQYETTEVQKRSEAGMGVLSQDWIQT